MIDMSIKNGARHRYTYNGRLIGNSICPIKWHNGSDLEGHSPVVGLFKCNPSNICAAFYTISSDSVLARFLCISRACY